MCKHVNKMYRGIYINYIKPYPNCFFSLSIGQLWKTSCCSSREDTVKKSATDASPTMWFHLHANVPVSAIPPNDNPGSSVMRPVWPSQNFCTQCVEGKQIWLHSYTMHGASYMFTQTSTDHQTPWLWSLCNCVIESFAVLVMRLPTRDIILCIHTHIYTDMRSDM